MIVAYSPPNQRQYSLALNPGLLSLSRLSLLVIRMYGPTTTINYYSDYFIVTRTLEPSNNESMIEHLMLSRLIMRFDIV